MKRNAIARIIIWSLVAVLLTSLLIVGINCSPSSFFTGDWSSGIIGVTYKNSALYNVGGGERAAYEFAGNTLKDISVDAAGNVALLLGSGQLHQAVLLDKSLNVQFSGTVSSANSIVRAGSLFYLLSDSGVECYNTSGEQQWSQTLAAKPQALLADTKELLLFSGNTAQTLEVPQK